MPWINKPKPVRRPEAVQRSKERQEIYCTRRWRNLRASKLMQQPLCERCLEHDRTTLATEVHHIDSFMNYQGPRRVERAYDFTNLKSLCDACHREIHRQQERDKRYF